MTYATTSLHLSGLSQDCEWSVEAPPGYKIRLEFLCSFSMESTSSSTKCDNDYLMFREPFAYAGGNVIFHPLSLSARLNLTSFIYTVFRHCGSSLTPRDPYVSLTNRIKIEFHSDSDDLVAKGFVLRVVFEKGQ